MRECLQKLIRLEVKKTLSLDMLFKVKKHYGFVIPISLTSLNGIVYLFGEDSIKNLQVFISLLDDL